MLRTFRNGVGPRNLAIDHSRRCGKFVNYAEGSGDLQLEQSIDEDDRLQVESAIPILDYVFSEVTQEEQYIHVAFGPPTTNTTEDTFEIRSEDQSATPWTSNNFHLIQPHDNQATGEHDSSALPGINQCEKITNDSVSISHESNNDSSTNLTLKRLQEIGQP